MFESLSYDVHMTVHYHEIVVVFCEANILGGIAPKAIQLWPN